MPSRSFRPTRHEERRELIGAIQAVDLVRVTELLRSDPALSNAPSSHRNVPLADAIETGDLDLVKLLIKHGADPHHRNHGERSLLEAAAYSGRLEIAAYLISLGVEPTVHQVAAMGDVDLLAGMIKENAALLEPTAAGGRWRMSPLHAAALAGSVAAVEVLLTLGAAVDALNHNGHTPLALTTECGAKERRVPVAELLLSRGADANAEAGHHGGTVLHRAVMERDQDLARLLFERGADTDRQDWSGKTPLHHAVARNRRLVELCLRHSPDLAITCSEGETALDSARRQKKSAIVKLLEEAG
jgi:ankyrin repeat protein